MSTVSKIITALVALVVLAVVGLSLFIRFYFTDARVRALLLPQAEKALGRKVELGRISVGLFSGVVVDTVAVKEADGTKDFIAADRFVLKYSLLPLLQKQLLIHEISLQGPRFHVSRGADGRFNYESLAVLAAPAGGGAKPAAPAGGGGLPLSLTVQQIAVRDGKLTFTDATKALPDVQADFSCDLAVALGRAGGMPALNGTMRLDAVARRGTAAPRVTGTAELAGDTVTLDLTADLDGQQLRLAGSAKDLFGAPQVNLDLTSKELDVDKLLAVLGTLTGAGPAPVPAPRAAAKPQPPQALAKTLPPGLTAAGKVAVEKALYKGMAINALLLRYHLERGILKVEELGALALGGSLNGTMELDLNQPDPVYSGQLGVAAVQADRLQSTLAKTARALFTGALETSLRFTGRGFAPEIAKKNLTADGTFAVKDGRFQETPLTTGLAGIVGLNELRTLQFQDFSGTFQIVKGGRVRLDSTIDSATVKAKAAGEIGLDGSLDLPISLTLPPSVARRLGSAGRFLTDSAGNTTLSLKLAGNLASPRPTLDQGAVTKQVQQAVQRKLLNRLGVPAGGSAGGATTAPSPTGLLKGLFGR